MGKFQNISKFIQDELEAVASSSGDSSPPAASVKSSDDAAALKMGYLNEYLANQGNFAAEELRDRMVAVYKEAKIAIPEEERCDGDLVFARMISLGAPRQQSPYQDAFIVVFAKYFETCDVFEDPRDE